MDFYKKYCELKIRTAPFRMKSDYEYVKTVSVIDALSDRADLIHNGAKIGGRFNWQGGGYETTNLMGEAIKYLEALEGGEMPLKGMFTEPGIAVVDHTFVEKDGKLHVFYNRAYIGYWWTERFVDTFGHAVTENLIDWEVLPPVFSAQKGGHDDYQIWSPGIVEYNNLYYMFYTGVNYNIAQAACLATSHDLINWTRCEKNPVFIPGEWCGWSKDIWSDCRDSMVFANDDGMFYMYYCTSKKETDGRTPNVMGIASSRDLINWEDKGFVMLDNVNHYAESPFVMKRNGTYYMFFTSCGKGTAYATSSSPTDGWSVLPNDKNLLIEGANCSEVIEFKGQWYITAASPKIGGQQYLEFWKFYWNDDGTVHVGEKVK